MKSIFLTSWLGYNRRTFFFKRLKVCKCNNSNHFIDRLRLAIPQINKLVYIASNPSNYEKVDKYSKVLVQSLNLDGFNIKELVAIDYRYNKDLEKEILSADVVFLSGGNVPMQNNFFKEIGLKSILEKYNGVIIGQSAGSMNCSEMIYVLPEEDEEFEDKNFAKTLTGLGLIDFQIMPHMNSANRTDGKGHKTIMQMCIEDSHKIPHYGICDFGFVEVKAGKAVAYGKTLLLKDGACKEICKDGESIELSSDYDYKY